MFPFYCDKLLFWNENIVTFVIFPFADFQISHQPNHRLFSIFFNSYFFQSYFFSKSVKILYLCLICFCLSSICQFVFFPWFSSWSDQLISPISSYVLHLHVLIGICCCLKIFIPVMMTHLKEDSPFRQIPQKFLSSIASFNYYIRGEIWLSL